MVIIDGVALFSNIYGSGNRGRHLFGRVIVCRERTLILVKNIEKLMNVGLL